MRAPKVKHVLQEDLPWRDDPPISECGRAIMPGVETITRDELVKLLGGVARDVLKAFASGRMEDGERVLDDVCMMCCINARRRCSWSESPTDAVTRWLTLVPSVAYSAAAVRANAELLALADLAVKYRGEFEQLRDRHAALITLTGNSAGRWGT